MGLSVGSTYLEVYCLLLHTIHTADRPCLTVTMVTVITHIKRHTRPQEESYKYTHTVCNTVSAFTTLQDTLLQPLLLPFSLFSTTSVPPSTTHLLNRIVIFYFIASFCHLLSDYFTPAVSVYEITKNIS